MSIGTNNIFIMGADTMLAGVSPHACAASGSGIVKAPLKRPQWTKEPAGDTIEKTVRWDNDAF